MTAIVAIVATNTGHEGMRRIDQLEAIAVQEFRDKGVTSLRAV